NISLRMSILQGSASGTTVYSETHAATSNDYGVFDLVVGNGAIISGNFSAIDWGSDIYFLKVEMDGTGGTNYEFMGTSQLLSVPYALHAKTAENVTGTITETDPVFTAWDKTTGISITESQVSDLQNYLTSEVDGSVTNELQVLSISNDTIYLSNGGFVKLPAGFDGQYSSLTGAPSLATVATSGSYNDLNSQPAIPANVSELNNDTGYLITEVDGSVTNELQALSISNDTIYLSNGGFVKLPAGFSGNYNDLTNKPNLATVATSGSYTDLTNTPSIPANVSQLTNDAGYITGFTEVDGSVTNELQALSISNDTVYLSNGGFVKLPAGFSGNYNDLTNKPDFTGWDTNVANDFNGDYNNLTNTPTIPANVSQLTNDAGYITGFTEVDGSVTNELQALSISNDTIYLSNGGFVKLPAGFSGNYNDLVNQPTIPTNVSELNNDSGYLTSEQDTVIWKKNSTNIFYNSGNVGIGTTSPVSSLDIYKDADGYDMLTLRNYHSGSYTYSPGGLGISTINSVTSDANAALYINDSTTSRFVVKWNGNVGIGTTGPGAKLDVQQVSGTTKIATFSGVQAANTQGHFIQFDGGVAGATVRGQLGYTKTGSGSPTFWTNEIADYFALASGVGIHIGNWSQATPEMTIVGGNVGIGTTSPNSKLQVTSGDAYIQTQGNGLILRATDGANCYRITVNNAGTISTTPVACP
ncbi:MAG: hypothetical protein HY738_13245, partial [Bacteroidia bacterium]|nr:hypothetical protein [Bacteroidia bacterium]